MEVYDQIPSRTAKHLRIEGSPNTATTLEMDHPSGSRVVLHHEGNDYKVFVDGKPMRMPRLNTKTLARWFDDAFRGPESLIRVASAGGKTASGAVNARYLASLPAPKKATILKAVAKHYGVSVREIEGELTDRDAEELYEYLAFDNRLAMQVYRDFQDGRFASAGGKTARVKSKLDSMGMIRDLEKKHGKGSKAYYEAVIKEVKAGVIAPAAVVGGGYKDGKKVAIKWLEDQMKSAKTASEKEATEYGMYGSPAKVARLGLTACAGVKEAAGELAADLHRRRSAAHSLYTGFLGEHAKTGKCKYSRMLLSYYPDESMKVASLPAPSSVDDWLAWND